MMIDCLLSRESKYYAMINESIAFVENRYPVEVCFGAIIGSIGYNLNNKTSDVDLVLYYTPDPNIDLNKRTELNKAVLCNDLVGAIMFDVELLNQAHLPAENVSPEISPAYIKPHLNFDYTILPGSTNCRLRSALTEALFCRKLWDDRAYLINNMETLKSQLVIYDFLKRQYIYARGRLDKYLVGEKVRIRSYLYTARDILAVKHILGNRSFPTLDFLLLLDECGDSEAKKLLSDLYFKNLYATEGKDKALIEPLIFLNDYFNKELIDMKPAILNFYKNYKNSLFDIVIKKQI